MGIVFLQGDPLPSFWFGPSLSTSKELFHQLSPWCTLPPSNVGCFREKIDLPGALPQML